MSQLLNGVDLILADGRRVDAGRHLTGKIVALYFTASWWPPCRVFTPKLKRFVDTLRANGKKDFEVIFVTRDRMDHPLNDFRNELVGVWSYLPLDTQFRIMQNLLVKYDVKSIPSLRLINCDGTIVSWDAKQEIEVAGLHHALDLYYHWKAFAF